MEQLRALMRRWWKAQEWFANADPDEAEKQLPNYEKLLIGIRDLANKLDISQGDMERMLEEARG